MLQHATWQRSLHIQPFINLAHKIWSKPTRCSPNTFSCKTSRRFTVYFSNFVYKPTCISLRRRQQRRDIPEKAHGITSFSIFISPETEYSEKLSVTISSWSPGCSTAIESLIPALTARVLQLYAAVPTRAGVFTTVMWFYHCPMN